MSYFTLSSGEKLYYEDRGRGPETLIMMHGWTSSHLIYKIPVKLLKKKARCIIYDHRGHGKSKGANSGSPTMETLADDLNEIIQGLSLSNITLLGWSMGAGVVFNYVRRYGCGALKQIILCDMTPKQLNDEEWKLGLYQGRYTRADLEWDGGKDFFPVYEGFSLEAIPKMAKMPEALRKEILKKILARCDEPVIKSLAASMKYQDNRPVVEQITVPVTYFYSDPGTLFSPKLAGWYRKHVRTRYRTVRFPKSTHMLIVEYPKKFAKAVRAVLRQEVP